ncbi:MAG: ATP-binding protein [Oscillospiraceae bacterium]|nr:ATP-binding protein [Oscillospiraceae bacterium]
MGYEKEVLARARRRHQEAVAQFQRTQRERRERVYREYPRVQEIDQQLRRTMAEFMAETFRNGQDPREAVELLRRENLHLQQERRDILRRSGYGENYLNDGPMCRLCSDTGYVGEKMCSCLEKYCQEEQRKTLTSLLSVNLSSFDDFSLDYYNTIPDHTLGISPREQMEMVYETCVDYARKFSLRSKSLLMNGGTGLGKTFLSACIARQVVSMGFSVVYDTAIHVFSCLEKEKFGNADAEEKRMAQRIMECDLLILDDLGTEMSTSFISPALYGIINGRILENKPTIISTNLTLGELSRRYTPQIASRLMGEYISLVFIGQDIRLQKAQG